MNQKEIKELIEFLVEKDIAEFELERGDIKIRIKRGQQGRGCFRWPTPAATPCRLCRFHFGIGSGGNRSRQ